MGDRGNAGWRAGVREQVASGAPQRGDNIVVIKDKYGLQRRVKLYGEAHLLGIERAQLRRHAQNLQDALGPQRCLRPVPDEKEELVQWILGLQGSLGGASPLASRSVSPTTRAPTGWAHENDRISPDLVSTATREVMSMSPQRQRPQTYVLEEAHSTQAMALLRGESMMAAAILREINDGVQKFHDGAYSGDIWTSQKALAKDIYNQLHSEKRGSFLAYKDRFLNFSVVCGNIAYSGNIPCFRYKVAYPMKFQHLFASAYVSIFFTLKEDELRRLMR